MEWKPVKASGSLNNRLFAYAYNSNITYCDDLKGSAPTIPTIFSIKTVSFIFKYSNIRFLWAIVHFGSILHKEGPNKKTNYAMAVAFGKSFNAFKFFSSATAMLCICTHAKRTAIFFFTFSSYPSKANWNTVQRVDLSLFFYIILFFKYIPCLDCS